MNANPIGVNLGKNIATMRELCPVNIKIKYQVNISKEYPCEPLPAKYSYIIIYWFAHLICSTTAIAKG